MNIHDRESLYAEVARVLRPGAAFGIYDVMRGNANPLDYPVPWATTAETSRVLTPEETRASLGGAGFEVTAYADGARALALALVVREYVERRALAARGVWPRPPGVGQRRPSTTTSRR